MVESVFRQTNLYIYFGEETKCCGNKGLEKETRKFFQGVISFNQEVGICKKCGKIFILKTNEENLRLFCEQKISLHLAFKLKGLEKKISRPFS